MLNGSNEPLLFPLDSDLSYPWVGRGLKLNWLLKFDWLFRLLIVPLAIEIYGKLGKFSNFLLLVFDWIIPSPLDPLLLPWDEKKFCLSCWGLYPLPDLSPVEFVVPNWSRNFKFFRINCAGSCPSPAILCKSDLLEMIWGGLCCEKSGDCLVLDSWVEGVTRSERVKNAN